MIAPVSFFDVSRPVGCFLGKWIAPTLVVLQEDKTVSYGTMVLLTGYPFHSKWNKISLTFDQTNIACPPTTNGSLPLTSG